MFWGLIMEPNKRYSQTVEKAFHVSMATLDVTTADDNFVQVMLCYDNRNYLLCNLQKTSPQVPLDLTFKEGTKIAFTSNGRGHVHLTGYLIPEDLEGFDDQDDLDEEAEDEEEDEEEVPVLVDKQGKRKAQVSPAEKAAKKAKSSKNVESEEDEDDDDEDDDDEEDEDDEANESAELEGDDSDEEDSDEDNDDDDDEDDEEEEEEESPVAKNKLNKSKQKQQLNQSKKSVDKSQMVNGKDVKSKKKNDEVITQNNDQQMQKKKVLTGGVQIEDLKAGNGAPAKAGKFVSVYYVGRLKNGKKFDATTSGDGFKFRLGKGEVIKGWDVGVQGMKVGGKRRITIPPAMAYGARGSPPVIPGNSTLIFEVELRGVH